MIKREKNEIINAWYQSSLTLAISAGAFTLIILALLIFNYAQLKSSDPLNSTELTELKDQLFRDPANNSVKEQIRTLDLQLREAYFRHRKFSSLGSYLLVGSSAIFLIGIRFVYSYREKLPMPQEIAPQKSKEELKTRGSKIAFGIAGLFAFIGLIFIVLNSSHSLSGDFLNDAQQIVATAKIKADEANQSENQQAAGENAVTQVPETIQTSSEPGAQATGTLAPTSGYPSTDEINKNWSRFRGPEGLGISYYSNIPSSWNGKTGENILWKTPVPLPGENSPIVWGKRLFVTGATESKREVYCFDTDSGKLLWQKAVENVPGSSPKPPKVSEETGFAAPTATTDGQRVFAIFANGDLISLDFSGNFVWAKNLGTPKSMYGYASSLLMSKNLLIVLYDQGGAEDNLSKIMAFDSSSGSLIWETKRPAPNSWATPIIINTGKREELITSSSPWVISYNPANGSELWRASCLSGDIAPSPVFANGLVYATNAYAKLAAIRPDGQGDVTATNIAWTADSGLPDICSPLIAGDLLFLLQTYGLMTCYDAKSGKVVWENDFAETFQASPSLAGDKVYLLTVDGLMIVIKLDRKVEEVGRYELGEKTNSCPAFLDGRIYIRGKNNLYCIGKR